LFGSLHIPNGYAQAFAAAALGIVASLIAIRTGGIAFTFGMHLINNLFGAVVVVSADDVFKGLPALITQNTPFLTWWDSGVELVLLVSVGWFVLTRLRIPENNGPEMVGA
jgi:membrane protease YdiL (CAAX protease family)